MVGQPLHKRAVTVLVVFATLGLALASPALCQIPSDADTMRILEASALPGDTVVVDFFLRNVNVLGGYTFRLRYDPSLIEPLTDTIPGDTAMVFRVEAQQLRGASFEAFGGYVRSLGEMVFGAFDLLHAPYSPDTTFFLAGRGVAARLKWRVLPSATPQVTPIYFENDPILPQSFNTLTDLSGLIFKRPVLIPGSFTILAYNCRWLGDANNNGVAYEIGDLVSLLLYTFSGGAEPPKDPSCPRANRGDINCDGVVDVMDIVSFVDIIVGEVQPPVDPCSGPH